MFKKIKKINNNDLRTATFDTRFGAVDLSLFSVFRYFIRIVTYKYKDLSVIVRDIGFLVSTSYLSILLVRYTYKL